MIIKKKKNISEITDALKTIDFTIIYLHLKKRTATKLYKHNDA